MELDSNVLVRRRTMMFVEPLTASFAQIVFLGAWEIDQWMDDDMLTRLDGV